MRINKIKKLIIVISLLSLIACGGGEYKGLELSSMPNASWSGRDSFATVLSTVKEPGLLLIGGFTPERTNEVFFTSNFRRWEKISTLGNLPSPRNGHCAIKYKERIFLIGGYDGEKLNSDVYTSLDGVIWEKMNNAAFAPRAFFGCLQFNEKIFVFGGNGKDNSALNDVWYTNDGVTWQMITNSAPWEPRGMFAHFVLNGSIYIVGGGEYDNSYAYNVKKNYSSIYKSKDGVNWEEINNPYFGPRRFMTSVVHSGRAYIIGGFQLDPNLFNDMENGVLLGSNKIPLTVLNDYYNTGRNCCNLNEIYSTEDGMYWKKEIVPQSFTARHAAGSASFNGKMYIFGGFGKELFNDVWQAD